MMKVILQGNNWRVIIIIMVRGGIAHDMNSHSTLLQPRRSPRRCCFCAFVSAAVYAWYGDEWELCASLCPGSYTPCFTGETCSSSLCCPNITVTTLNQRQWPWRSQTEANRQKGMDPAIHLLHAKSSTWNVDTLRYAQACHSTSRASVEHQFHVTFHTK